ncbi:MAG: EAL domain-containing protein (putative c-di-GMP-specific phosphodiesterase class I) [Candidatus Paceibacteria bacterium]|jgi:EAL domain-containing protein (putative c-di-GMP-specific phosphodiesterase class I)/CheY-like chemotaxis protein
MESPTTEPRFKSLVLASEAPNLDEGTLQSMLCHAGYRIQRTTFGATFETLERDLPDVILIDACKKPEEALKLCAAVRANYACDSMPIVMLHDHANSSWIDEACAAGATEFLETPMNSDLIERRLDGAIAYVERLLDDTLLRTDPLGKFGSARSIATTSGFPRLVSLAIEQSRGSDEVVCVLAVRATCGASQNQSLPDTFANQLSRSVREFEQGGLISHPKGHIVISRLNEECYVLLVPELGRLQDAARLGYKIHECLMKEGNGQYDSVEIGIATSPGDSNEGNNLLHLAEKAATYARQDEGSTLHFHTSSTNRWVFERLTLERSLRNSLDRNELVVFYQPKVDIATQAVVGFEALVRWQHPELGMVSPGQFIPLAEETGLIVPIGEWVLETACRQVKQWEQGGFMPVRMAVNLSPVQFRKNSLCDTVAEILERTGLSPSLLELEVTESMLMHSLKDTVNTLQRLKAMGIYLSIDDFGTGYSSLSYLKGFPIDALKIDQSFVRDITAKADDAAIATSIILMGRSLNLNVIAEGVETESQRAFLEVLQCNEFQGFLVSPPVPAEKAEAFLTRAV